MAIHTEKTEPGRSSSRKMNGWLALSPLFVFLAVYLAGSLVAHDFYKVPVAAAFIVASAYSLLITRGVKTTDEKISIFSEGAGNKNLILDVTGASIKEAFSNAMQVRRAALKGGDRTFGYPSIVNTARLARGDSHMQAALASMFTLRYGSIVVLDSMSYAEALPLYGLRQNIFTDPQKPMKVEPGVYPLNGADENSICCVTVDFALTYFVVSGELERSGVPINMFITDAGGYSVLTSWAAGKFSAGTIEKFFKDFDIDAKYKNKVLILPGKVAVLKGELEARLPNWRIVVGTTEAIQLVRFLREFK